MSFDSRSISQFPPAAYRNVIKEVEKRIRDCVADVTLRPTKVKLKVAGD